MYTVNHFVVSQRTLEIIKTNKNDEILKLNNTSSCVLDDKIRAKINIKLNTLLISLLESYENKDKSDKMKESEAITTVDDLFTDLVLMHHALSMIGTNNIKPSGEPAHNTAENLRQAFDAGVMKIKYVLEAAKSREGDPAILMMKSAIRCFNQNAQISHLDCLITISELITCLAIAQMSYWNHIDFFDGCIVKT